MAAALTRFAALRSQPHVREAMDSLERFAICALLIAAGSDARPRVTLLAMRGDALKRRCLLQSLARNVIFFNTWCSIGLLARKLALCDYEYAFALTVMRGQDSSPVPQSVPHCLKYNVRNDATIQNGQCDHYYSDI